MDFEDLPKTFSGSPLTEEEMDKDPFEQFFQWLKMAKSDGVLEYNAMSLATASIGNVPSCRTVLLKRLDQRGLVFFTNYSSRKAQELLENPLATAVFFWKEQVRQVVVEGHVEKISEKESEEYFAKRSKQSQISAWASKQGNELSSKDELLTNYHFYSKKFEESQVPLPPFWGGFLLKPTVFEFWQGGENRLHDRFCYRKNNREWVLSRLSP